MRLTVVHDIQGNIASVAASPRDSPVMYLELKPGQQVSEVDAPELAGDQAVEHIRARLTDVIENHRVANERTAVKLTKKPSP